MREIYNHTLKLWGAAAHMRRVGDLDGCVRTMHAGHKYLRGLVKPAWPLFLSSMYKNALGCTKMLWNQKACRLAGAPVDPSGHRKWNITMSFVLQHFLRTWTNGGAQGQPPGVFVKVTY